MNKPSVWNNRSATHVMKDQLWLRDNVEKRIENHIANMLVGHFVRFHAQESPKSEQPKIGFIEETTHIYTWAESDMYKREYI